MNMGTEYQNYEKLIYKKAHSFNATTGVPFDDLVAEGNLIFCEACMAYQNGRAAFSTYLWKRLDKGLYNFTMKYNRHTGAQFIPTDMERENGCNPHNGINTQSTNLACNKFESYTDFLLLKESLSDKGYMLVSAITDDPHKVLGLGDFGKPKNARGSIFRHLKNNEGWSWSVIWSTFNEVKVAVI